MQMIKLSMSVFAAVCPSSRVHVVLLIFIDSGKETATLSADQEELKGKWLTIFENQF